MRIKPKFLFFRRVLLLHDNILQCARLNDIDVDAALRKCAIARGADLRLRIFMAMRLKLGRAVH